MKNLVQAIVNSNLSAEEKVNALALIGHKSANDRERNQKARQEVIKALLVHTDTPQAAKDIKEESDRNLNTAINGALRVLTRCGVIKAVKVKFGTVKVEIDEWRSNRSSPFYGEWVTYEKEIPNTYNAYILNI